MDSQEKRPSLQDLLEALSNDFRTKLKNQTGSNNQTLAGNEESDEECVYETQELSDEEQEACDSINPNLKFYIVYTHGVNREDYSVLYSDLVIATSEQNAIIKYCNWLKSQNSNSTVSPSNFGDDEPYRYGITELEAI